MSETVQKLYSEYQEAAKRLTDAMRVDPPEPVGDYTFKTPDGSVTLSELFGGRDELLLIHNMGKACSYCTLWADGLNGQADHYADRSAFVVVSPDESDVQAEFARSRGWRFPTASCAGTTFAKDMGYEPEPGKFWPGASAFLKRPDGSIVRTGRTMFGPGDPYCPIWHLMDLLPRGRGEWAPKYAYDAAPA
jgi:predicted dithiol-disulfide oxidoreductase (DUF899 family)